MSTFLAISNFFFYSICSPIFSFILSNWATSLILVMSLSFSIFAVLVSVFRRKE